MHLMYIMNLFVLFCTIMNMARIFKIPGVFDIWLWFGLAIAFGRCFF